MVFRGDLMAPIAAQRLTALAGLAGALVMFVGDLLFYGQWASGAEGLRSSLAVVETRSHLVLALGGWLSSLGGLGYMVGVVHVWSRTPSASLQWRVVATGLIAFVISIAIATHAVWGAFALTAGRHGSVTAYLSVYFRIGMLVAVPASLVLAGLVVTGKTTWPRWSVALNPGLIYAVLSTAAWLPAPIGAAVVGGAFNLAFAAFFAMSLATAKSTAD